MHDTEYDLKNWTSEDIAEELEKVRGEMRELQPKIIKGGADPDERA